MSKPDLKLDLSYYLISFMKLSIHNNFGDKKNKLKSQSSKKKKKKLKRSQARFIP